MRLPDGVAMVGFADDVTLVTVRHTTEGLQLPTNEALRLVEGWMNNNGLELAHSKTEAVILTRK